ncbi:MAG: AMP-binding protein [Candidatus Moduliflexus flocculans]|nr:AMP-binding protein [Candidatus Moduliflexus flocculans]
MPSAWASILWESERVRWFPSFLKTGWNGFIPIWARWESAHASYPIYPTLPSDEIEYIINNSESKVILPENKAQLKKVLEVLDKCPSIEKIIVMEEKDATGHPKVMSFNALMELGRKKYAEDPLSLKNCPRK